VTSLTKQKAQWEERLANENREEAAALHRRKEEAAQELAAAQEEVRAIQDQEDGVLPPDLAEEMDDLREELRGRKRLMTGLVVLMVLLTIVAAGLYLLPVFVPSWPLAVPAVPWLFVAGAGILLWLLVLVAALGKAVGDRRAKKKLRKLQAQAETHPRRTMEEALIQRDRAKRYYDALVQQEGGRALPPEAEACQESLHAAQRELAQVQGQLSALGDPVLVDAQLDQVQETLAAQQEDYDALDIALEALQEADEQIHARLSPQLSRQAGEYFSRLTQGRYTGVGLTRDLAVTVREGTDLADQPLSYLSQGTVDQLYLALRLALAQVVLPAGADCPMVLDDALVTFDDTRLALALRLLQDLSRSRQVLLFTCQSREGQMLEGQPGVTIQERG
jgi:hypothetical protein